MTADRLPIAYRIETEEPSKALREDIARALGYSPGAGRLWWTPDRTGMTALPDWLTSIDAAAALMPEGWSVTIYSPTADDPLWAADGCPTKAGCPLLEGRAPTEARARTAAALRAIEAEKGK